MAGLAAGRLFRASIVAVGALLLLALACPVRAGVLDTTWNAPTTHLDGRPLTTLKYYRVYYGTSNPPCPTSPSLVVPSITLAPAPGTVVSATLTGLITGTLYFIQVTAVDEDGDESACSSPASGVTRPAQLAVTITSVDIDPTTTGVKTLIVAGAVSGNEGVPQVSWTNSQGDSGTASGTTNWTVSGLVLQPGANVLTITATDEARNAGRAILTVDYVPLDVTITSATVNPTTTGTKTLTLAGTVSGHEGVPQVTWANSHGDGGTATGTTNWTASGIILQPGANVLTITARDAAGNAGATIFTVNYAPPPTITSINPTSVIAAGSGSVSCHSSRRVVLITMA